MCEGTRKSLGRIECMPSRLVSSPAAYARRLSACMSRRGLCVLFACVGCRVSCLLTCLAFLAGGGDVTHRSRGECTPGEGYPNQPLSFDSLPSRHENVGCPLVTKLAARPTNTASRDRHANGSGEPPLPDGEAPRWTAFAHSSQLLPHGTHNHRAVRIPPIRLGALAATRNPGSGARAVVVPSPCRPLLTAEPPCARWPSGRP